MKRMRSTAWAVNAFIVILFTSVLFGYVCGRGANHVVGGRFFGWDLCNSDIQTWVSRTTFNVNDILEFSYAPCNDVIEVTKEDYDTCTITNPLITYPDEFDTVILLTAPGTRYFINGELMNQCQKCLKLQVQVVANATSNEDQNPDGGDSDDDCLVEDLEDDFPIVGLPCPCSCPDKIPPCPLAFPPAPF